MNRILVLLVAILMLTTVLACEKNPFSGSSSESNCLRASNPSYRVQERQLFWCYIAWKVELKNVCSRPIDAIVTFQFCDEDGFVLDYGFDSVVMAEYSTTTMQDLTTVKVSVESRIHHCVVKLEYRNP